MDNNSGKKYKIAQIIIHLANGGTESLLREYVTQMDKNKFENIVICVQPSLGSASEKALAEAGIKVYFVGDQLGKGKDPVRQAINCVKTYRIIYDILEKENVYAVHTHLSTNRFAYKFIMDHRDVKYFHTVHCPVAWMFNEGLKAKIENIIVKSIIKNRQIKFIALHRAMADEINKWFNVNDTEVLENGIHLDIFRNPGVTKSEIRKEIGIPENAFVLGHVGRMAPEKNHKKIFEVFKELKKRRPDAILLLVGNGRCEDEVKQLNNKMGLSDSTFILSNRTDVNRLLKAMDVFIFPSLFEGLGIALIEAEASGLKCVISDTVPKETHLVENLSALPLDESASVWCDAVLDNSIKNPAEGDINAYDIKNVMKKLEGIYTN